jgi:hypothetical protein
VLHDLVREIEAAADDAERGARVREGYRRRPDGRAERRQEHAC